MQGLVHLLLFMFFIYIINNIYEIHITPIGGVPGNSK